MQVLELATVQSRIFPDQDVCKPRQYDMVIWGRSGVTQLDPDWLRLLFHGNCQIGVNNRAGYRNLFFDRLAVQQVGGRKFRWAAQRAAAPACEAGR